MFKILLVLSAAVLSSTAHSAILIESINDEGKKGRVVIDEGRARVDAGVLGGYMLINLNDGVAYVIDHSERVILDLSSPMVNNHPHSEMMKQVPPPRVSIKKKGKGPVVAGYQTIRYRVSINGLHCFDELLSEQLLTYPHVKRFVEVIGAATGADAESGMGVPFDDEAPCESADELFDDHYHKLGLPMRTIDSNGLVSHEITRVDTDLDPPAGTFASPPGYKKVTREELVQRSAANIPARGNMTDLSNEDVEKMRKQIIKQLDIMKKRRAGDATAKEDININTAPINK